ncbi:MAG: F0F1 ATP synthase subunit B family protein [Roseibacillus sp.]
MNIDWFTFVAQILNFFILVWILKRFLYKPILKAMSERKEQIQKTIVEANDEKKKTQEERARFEQKNAEITQQRETFLKEAKTEAEKEHQRLLKEAREEFETARLRYQEALKREKEDFQQEMSRSARAEVIAISQRLLNDLADSELQQRMAHKFCQRLTDLREDEKKRLRESLKESVELPALIRSTFELTKDDQMLLEDSVTKILGKVPLKFETSSSLGFGIELAVDGQKITWTIKDYLRSLETCLNNLLQTKTPKDAPSTQQPVLAPA